MRHASMTVWSAFRDSVENSPDEPAILFRDLSVSYAELARKVDQLAAGLYDTGVRSGQHVGLWLPNYPEWIYTALAVARLGAVVVPISSSFNGSEVAYVLQRSEVSTLVTTDSFLNIRYAQVLYGICPELEGHEPGRLRSDRFPELRRVISVTYRQLPGCLRFLDVMECGLQQHLQSAMRRVSASHSPVDPLFYIWTSGQNELPRGTRLTNQVLDSVFNYVDAMAMGRGDRSLASLPFSQLAGLVCCLLGPLVGSATMVLACEFTAEELLDLVQRYQVTVLGGLPGTYASCMDHPDLERFDLSSLRTGWIASTNSTPAVRQLLHQPLGLKSIRQVKLHEGPENVQWLLIQ